MDQAIHYGRELENLLAGPVFVVELRRGLRYTKRGGKRCKNKQRKEAAVKAAAKY